MSKGIDYVSTIINRLEIVHSDLVIINSIINNLKNDSNKQSFSFEKIEKMPEILKNSISNNLPNLYIISYLSEKYKINTLLKIPFSLEIKSTSLNSLISDMDDYVNYFEECYKKTGYLTAYDWAADKWGVIVDCYKSFSIKNIIYFHTLNLPVINLISKLSYQYPKVIFRYWYEKFKESNFNGFHSFKNGKLLSESNNLMLAKWSFMLEYKKGYKEAFKELN